MSDLSGFNAHDYAERTGGNYQAIPPGMYAVMATNNERKVNQKGTGEYLQFVLEVLDENYRGQKLWVRLNLWNPSKTAVSIANEELAELLRAVNIPQPDDSSELLNIPFIVDVIVEKDNRDPNKEVNKIKKYYHIDATFDTPTPTAAPKPSASAAAVAAAAKKPSPVWPGART